MKKLFLAGLGLMFMVMLSACSTAVAPDVDLDDLEGLTKEYLAPVFLASISSQNWQHAEEIPPHNLGLFFVAKRSLTDDAYREMIWDAAVFGQEDVEALVLQYFDIPVERLRESEYYQPQTESYVFESLGGAATARVVKAELQQNVLTLFYEYYSPADDATVIRKGTLCVTFSQEGYRYTSCTTSEV